MNPLSGQTVVITGGAGFIGSHLVSEVVGRGPKHVAVVDDLSSGSEENLEAVAGAIDLIVADISHDRALAAVAEADTVFHLAVKNVRASISRPVENMRVNSQGTLTVLEAMRKGSRGRFVYVSSSEVYGIPDVAQYAESTIPRPTTVYGAGKLSGEHVTHAYRQTYGMDVRVIRPFNNYGPRSHFEGDSGEVIPKFILRAREGLPLLIHGDGTQTRDFMYVEETAKWLVALAEEPRLKGETVNIGTGVETRIIDLAHVIRERLDSSSQISFGEPRPGDLPRLVADISKISALIPFKLEVDLKKGLDRTIDYFSQYSASELLSLEVAETWT